MILIDGSIGEGGGQILRTSLSLSMITGAPFRIEKIRAGRQRKGLLRQHLTSALAAAEVCGAQVKGAELGSTQLTFIPGPIDAGRFHFSVGSAGSTMLVLQTVLPALMLAKEASTLTLEGGTHNVAAPPYDFLDSAYLPLLRRMGPRVTMRLQRYGFYPEGADACRSRSNRWPGWSRCFSQHVASFGLGASPPWWHTSRDTWRSAKPSPLPLSLAGSPQPRKSGRHKNRRGPATP